MKYKVLPLKFLTSPRSRGFTIIEVLVVIAVLGAMAGVVVTLVNPVGQRNKGNDAKRKADLRQIQTALEFYRTDAGTYPASANCNGTLSYTDGSGSTTTYMSRVPCPPGGGSYHYATGTGNASYCLRTCLQTATDPDRDEINPRYGSNNNPTSAQMGASCTVSNCSGNTPKSYTVLNP